MTEPSSGVPSEIADANVDEAKATTVDEQQPERVELDVDEEKMEAWDEVKSDYQVDPDNQEDRLPGADDEGVDEGQSFEG
ncbi:hypothetical protein [Phycicoccus sp. Soil748]|uniref:hypothetical protein n=1 Tax=Phycicoccus sp. Soil748 TaxID=1736397 RepID=UPI0007037D9B|nr:hypothetical protein [Phycicoccus sp. Soil748]KRE57162.1 hypothetical protein ASG70_01665 [Phycicoccus sp. Soil748]